MAVSDVYRALWRRRYFVLLATALVVAATFVLTSRQTKLYTASSLVRVQQNVRSAEEAFGALLTGERLARTYERIAETDSVRDLVRAELGRSVPRDAVNVEAEQLSNLELLQITVTHENPRTAAVVANAVPRALAGFIEKTGSFRDTITVVERASIPTTPSSPNLRLNLVLAFLLGLILAGGLALLMDALSDRIEDVEELERVAGHPVIAVIPNLEFQPISRLRAREGAGALGAPVLATARRGNQDEVTTAAAEPSSRWSSRG